MPDGQVHKILICGDVKGKVNALYSRVSKVMSVAGQFDMLFCLGDFFGSQTDELERIIDGNLEVPIATYIVSPFTEIARKFCKVESGCELCSNLTYLGSRGTYTTVSGLRIVYMAELEVDSDNSNLPSSLLNDALAAEDYGFIGVDLLLTCQWPKHVNKLSAHEFPVSCQHCIDSSSILISRLAYLTRPRYHFSCGNGVYYERSPYRNHRVLQEKACHTTRFIALADVRNERNQKYLYALKLIPIDKMDHQDLISQPPDVTENPYREFVEHKHSADRETEVQTEQFFYNLDTEKKSEGTTRKSISQKRKMNSNLLEDANGAKVQLVDTNDTDKESLQEKIDRNRNHAACWFCLGNPQVKKHLIVSIGAQAYVALPRGPIVPDHALILTIGHHQNWIACPDYVRSEIEEYKSRLKRMYAAHGKVMVTFERNLKTQHYQLQVVPVPFSVAAEVKQVFLELSANADFSPCKLKPVPRRTELDEVCRVGIPYFFVELPTGEKLFGRIPKDRISSTNLQFGRIVLTDPRILNCPERADWHDCTDDEDEEANLTKQFRQMFSPYDNTE
ncbi:hypothetical protein MN116_006398 [Schistosoma mekongi]|uniref:CWF19-like protein 1 n=1 Tax=Schistosoma mekongi TaxID=38744 RepID=A0AAE1ZAV1_SCHME|nr:hypothetical protein MN116_006398 [Schistosoma mekongi]